MRKLRLYTVLKPAEKWSQDIYTNPGPSCVCKALVLNYSACIQHIPSYAYPSLWNDFFDLTLKVLLYESCFNL